MRSKKDDVDEKSRELRDEQAKRNEARAKAKDEREKAAVAAPQAQRIDPSAAASRDVTLTPGERRVWLPHDCAPLWKNECASFPPCREWVDSSIFEGINTSLSTNNRQG